LDGSFAVQAILKESDIVIRNLLRGLLGVWLMTSIAPVFAVDVVLNFSAAEKARCSYDSVKFDGNGTMNVTCAQDVTCPGGCGNTGLLSQTITFGSTVTGVAQGTCTITAKQAGNTSYSAAPNVDQPFTIAAAGSAPTCSATKPLIDDLDLYGTIGNGGYTKKFLVSPNSSFANFAVIAFKFTVPANAPVGRVYTFTYEQHSGGGTFSTKTSALSACAGDFSSIGVGVGVQPCVISADTPNATPLDGIGFRVGSNGYCELKAGGTYYLNVKSRIAGETIGFTMTSGTY
jgi:hypothetical protein